MDTSNADGTAEPWEVLTTPEEVELWIEHHNQHLQQLIGNGNPSGYGICLSLHHGGEIFMHTNPDGDILLDVTPEAEWVTPVIMAATQVQIPSSRIWLLPGDTLTQLMLGLNELISSSKTVVQHNFKTKRIWQ